MGTWQEENKVIGQVTRSAFAAMTDSIVDTHSAVTVLAITVAAEIGALAMVFVARDKVNEFVEAQGDFWIYASIGVFLVGFFTAFATIRLLERRFAQRTLPITIWLFSIIAGTANLALFCALLTLRIR